MDLLITVAVMFILFTAAQITLFFLIKGGVNITVTVDNKGAGPFEVAKSAKKELNALSTTDKKVLEEQREAVEKANDFMKELHAISEEGE